jgi:threonine/homoserine/homoserine lactone efflux protein
MPDFLMLGVILGLSAGMAPGPLMTLVVSESLRYGVRAGVNVAAAPLISDLPVILLAVYCASRLSGYQSGLGLISLAGGVFILCTGISCLRSPPPEISLQTGPPRSLLKGVVANLLNPHPYLFWISVGVPVMSRALKTDMAALPAFLCGFYACLVGSKVLLALAAGRSRSFLSGRLYRSILAFLGLLLAGFGLYLIHDGARLLQLL